MVGIGFALFVSFLLMNFITVSISYKKQEIGILRALGAKSKDVISIFFKESAIMNFLISSIITFIFTIVINNYLKSDFNMMITILNFGIRQMFILLTISILADFISSSILVYKFAKMKSIDIIKN